MTTLQGKDPAAAGSWCRQFEICATTDESPSARRYPLMRLILKNELIENALQDAVYAVCRVAGPTVRFQGAVPAPIDRSSSSLVLIPGRVG